MPRWAIVYVAALCGSAAFRGLRRSIAALASAPRPQAQIGCAPGVLLLLRLEIRRPSGRFDVPQRARFNQNFGQTGSHCWTEPTKRFLEAPSWIELYRSTHCSLDSPLKSDFSIGDRVQMSALGAARCPRHADKTGTIVGRSIYVNCARVLLDGNKSPISVHCDYLDSILPVNAAIQPR